MEASESSGRTGIFRMNWTFQPIPCEMRQRSRYHSLPSVIKTSQSTKGSDASSLFGC
jgi:hypothetical protein